jgi:hypothetical protein
VIGIPFNKYKETVLFKGQIKYQTQQQLYNVEFSSSDMARYLSKSLIKKFIKSALLSCADCSKIELSFSLYVGWSKSKKVGMAGGGDVLLQLLMSKVGLAA